MFFIKRKSSPEEIRKPTGFVFCVVPMGERTKKAYEKCMEHAKLISALFYKSNLHKWRFEFRQRSNTGYDLQGRIFMKLELVVEDLTQKCIVRFCGTEGGVWSYRLTHPDMDDIVIHDLIVSELASDKVFLTPRSYKKEAVDLFKRLALRAA